VSRHLARENAFSYFTIISLKCTIFKPPRCISHPVNIHLQNSTAGEELIPYICFEFRHLACGRTAETSKLPYYSWTKVPVSGLSADPRLEGIYIPNRRGQSLPLTKIKLLAWCSFSLTLRKKTEQPVIIMTINETSLEAKPTPKLLVMDDVQRAETATRFSVNSSLELILCVEIKGMMPTFRRSILLPSPGPKNVGGCVGIQ
jgi:hypothetical protein